MSKVGLLWHGDAAAKAAVDLSTSRFAGAADALREANITPLPVIYNDDLAEEAKAQLLTLDAVQIWVNPIVEGRTRAKLDDVLREVASQGVLVFTHPDLILRMGTKQVLFDTREMSFGSDVRVYLSLTELTGRLPEALKTGPRVLKQYRGHSGGGIWKVTPVPEENEVLLRHAERGSPEERMSLEDALARMAGYFEGGGRIIDQAYQSRLPEGMTRIYMVGDQVAGFGHQAINALYPFELVDDPATIPGPRLYYPPDQPEHQAIRRQMENDWLPALHVCLGIGPEELPLLWDADLMLGDKNSSGEDTYVLCEINVSSVSPYPESANPLMADCLKQRLSRHHH